MKRNQVFLCVALFLFEFGFNQAAIAKVWRVSNTPGIDADFTQLSTAVANTNVAIGDTVYVEPSASQYTSFTLNKRLVIIGPGFLLDENTGLHVNPGHANFNNIIVDSTASGSIFIGIWVNLLRLDSDVDNIIITRCRSTVQQNTVVANSKIQNLEISKSYVTIQLSTFILEDVVVRNSLITGFDISNAINGLVRNNVFNNAGNVRIASSYFSNNILVGSTLVALNSTAKYNLSTGGAATLPAGNNNQTGLTSAALFVNTGTTDARFQLAASSPAIGAGETVNGVTPDIGMYGTADPYRISGIPPVPTIYSLTVPASIPATATNMNITFSTRSNN